MRQHIAIIPTLLTVLVSTVACSSPSTTALAPESNPTVATAQTLAETPASRSTRPGTLISPTPTPTPPGGLVTPTKQRPDGPGDVAGELWEPTCPTGMTMVALDSYGPDQNYEFTRTYRCEQQVECNSPDYALEVSSAEVIEVFVDQGKKVYTFRLDCDVTNIHPEG